MNATTQQATGHRRLRITGLIREPTVKLEYAFYLAIIYSVLAPAVGLEIPLLAGVSVLAIWGFCVLRLQSSARVVFAPIALLIACVVSFLLIQVVVHGESILDSDIRAFITWIMGLMIVQSLCLRGGFSHRFPIVLLVIGAVTLPFIEFNTGEVEMARIDLAVQGSLTHPAGLADWFGFLAIFFAIFGLECRRASLRTGAWLIALGCLTIVTLSVERGPLFGSVLAITVGFRSILKRGFVPVLALVILAGVAYGSGLFDRAFTNYSERGMEDTGRGDIWAMTFERIRESPFVGVGESKILVNLSPTKLVPPHNSFLHFAVSSGVMPFLFFLAFWVSVTWRSVFHIQRSEDEPFRLPYLIFIFTGLMLGDTGFMSYGALLATSLVAGSAVRHDNVRAGVHNTTQGLRRMRTRPVSTTVRSRL